MKVHTISDKIRFIEKVFGKGRLAGNGQNFDVWCPICAPSDRSKKKLAIRVEDDANHCWTCGWRSRSLFPLLLKYATHDEVNEYKETFMPKDEIERLQRSRRCLIIDLDGNKRQFKLPNDFRMMVLKDGPFDPDHLAAQKYATMRGLSEHDMWYFKLGTSNQMKWNRRVLMPSFDAAGNINYLVGRAIDKGRPRKYDAPDIDKLSVIFNEINVDWTKRLVLCEGPFDLIRCGDNAVPLLGSDLNEESLLFEKILVNQTPVALALDADMLDTKVPRIARKLQAYGIDVKIVDVSAFGKSDPGEMTKEEFSKALEAAKSIEWLDFVMSKLRRASKTSLSVL